MATEIQALFPEQEDLVPWRVVGQAGACAGCWVRVGFEVHAVGS